MREILIVKSVLFLSLFCGGQDLPNFVEYTLIDNDTVFLSEVPEVEILAFRNKEERLRYYVLKRKVLKVYPYAIIGNEKLNNIKIGLNGIPRRRHKKRYTKEVARWVKEEYTDQLKNLTMSEGRILVKLIYRETQITSYELVKSYRGRFNAFFWQTIAKMYDNNLKARYDPIKDREDMLIEHIIIESKLEGRFD